MNVILVLIKDCLVEMLKNATYPVFMVMRLARDVALLIMSSITLFDGKLISYKLFEYTGPLLSDILTIYKENAIIIISIIFAVTWAFVHLLFLVILPRVNQDNTGTTEDNGKVNVRYWIIRDFLKMAFRLYYCGYVENATLQLLRNGVLLNEQKVVGGISIVVCFLIAYEYLYGINDAFARKNEIIKSDFCDVNGIILCLNDTVSWRGQKNKVSLINDEWCLTRRKSDNNRLLDAEKLKYVVEKDFEHLVLIKKT